MPFPTPPNDKHALEMGAHFTPNFDAHGLLPAIVQDAASGAVLMFAWMNASALDATLTSREATFFSRSRNRLWKKGEESGNVLRVVDVAVDCDQDVVLVRVQPQGQGVACHTGAVSCFYRKVVTTDKLHALVRV
jgi:phosphoribosyl-AMP cyclohydrolase